MKYNIERFTVCVISNDTCKFIAKTNFGNKINDEIRQMFTLLQQNDTVVFKDIYISKDEGNQLLESRIIKVSL
jgi:hypothetical protein